MADPADARAKPKVPDTSVGEAPIGAPEPEEVVVFDMAARRIFVDGTLRCDLSGSPRQLELVATLAAEGAAMRLERLARRSAKPLPPREARRALRRLERGGITVELEPDVWSLAFRQRGAVRPSPVVVGHGLERLQARLDADGRLGTDGDDLAAAVVDADVALQREDIVAAERILGARSWDGRSLASAIARTRSTAKRTKLGAVARSLMAKVAMIRGDLAGARRQLGLAEAQAAATDGMDEYLVSLACTRAAMWRMQAAFYPAAARDAVAQSMAAFRLAQDRARRAKLPLAVQNALISWTHSEATTPLAIVLGAHASSATTREAASHLATAKEFAAVATDPEASLANCLFMQLRMDLLEATGTRPEDSHAALTKRARAWQTSDGWLPRYVADLERASGAPPTRLRACLGDAWRRNEAHDFQRMLVLARFYYWRVDPTPAEPEEREKPLVVRLRREIPRFLSRWHTILRGIQASRCPTCRAPSSVQSRIACTLGLEPGGDVGPLSLGVWR